MNLSHWTALVYKRLTESHGATASWRHFALEFRADPGRQMLGPVCIADLDGGSFFACVIDSLSVGIGALHMMFCLNFDVVAAQVVFTLSGTELIWHGRYSRSGGGAASAKNFRISSMAVPSRISG